MLSDGLAPNWDNKNTIDPSRIPSPPKEMGNIVANYTMGITPK